MRAKRPICNVLVRFTVCNTQLFLTHFHTTHSLTRLTHSLTRLTHSLTHSLSLAHSLTHSLTHSLSSTASCHSSLELTTNGLLRQPCQPHHLLHHLHLHYYLLVVFPVRPARSAVSHCQPGRSPWCRQSTDRSCICRRPAPQQRARPTGSRHCQRCTQRRWPAASDAGASVADCAVLCGADAGPPRSAERIAWRV